MSTQAQSLDHAQNTHTPIQRLRKEAGEELGAHFPAAGLGERLCSVRSLGEACAPLNSQDNSLARLAAHIRPT
jgi:hypothetical protein